MSLIEDSGSVVLNLNGLAWAVGGARRRRHYVVASRIERIYLGQPETYINLIPGSAAPSAWSGCWPRSPAGPAPRAPLFGRYGPDGQR